MNLLPEVQNIEISDDKINLKDYCKFRVSGLAPELTDILRIEHPELKFERCDSPTDHAFIAGTMKKAVPDLPDSKDAYVIMADKNGVCISANSDTGLWYGVQTFFQIIKSGFDNAFTIIDAPAIQLRAIHYDLKGFQPRLDEFKNRLRLLSRFKINMILLELEDKYDYKCAPGVGVEGAYDYEAMRDISKFAKSLKIEIVPKVQSLAHVDYILKHKEYHSLRENNHPYQFCPENDDSFKLWAAMVDEVMDIFKEHNSYFHIGADEATNLGECPVCSKTTKADCFIKRVKQCIDYVLEKERTPIIWDDILRNKHGNVDLEDVSRTWELGKKAILMYWDYGYGGRNNTFPFISAYLAHGMRVWGASGFSGCDRFMGNIAPFDTRSANLAAWTKTAVENNLECVCATGWSRIVSCEPPAEPHDGSWYNILYAADCMWSGKEIETDNFFDRVSGLFFSNPVSEKLQKFVKDPSHLDFSFADLNNDKTITPELNLLQHLAVCESLEKPLNYLQYQLCMYEGMLGKQLPDYRLNALFKLLNEFDSTVESTSKTLEELLLPLYTTNTVNDFMISRFGYINRFRAEFRRKLEKTKLQ